MDTYMRLCSYVEHKSLNIYRNEKCFEQTLYKKSYTFYALYAFSHKFCGVKDNWTWIVALCIHFPTCMLTVNSGFPTTCEGYRNPLFPIILKWSFLPPEFIGLRYRNTFSVILLFYLGAHIRFELVWINTCVIYNSFCLTCLLSIHCILLKSCFFFYNQHLNAMWMLGWRINLTCLNTVSVFVVINSQLLRRFDVNFIWMSINMRMVHCQNTNI
jgi:hypothetical protein